MATKTTKGTVKVQYKQIATIRVNQPKKTSSHSWLENTNPLRNLTITEARNIYDAARRGNYARLQYLYDQVERADPVLLTCVERRASALASLGWQIVKGRGHDDAAAEAQINAVERFIDGIDNLSEAIEHLSLAFFRGFSHCLPVWTAEGYVAHIDKLNSWNFCRNVETGTWHWNEGADSILEPWDLPAIPKCELITVERPRAIDYPALSIFLRHNLAESDWGRFLERYGIPPCTITMPDNISPAEVQAFQEAAVAIAEARSGALPAGSQVSYGTEARGTDPFSAFIEHQEKLIVLLATGGTLTSLAESGAGTLAGNAQMDVWQQIVARDAEIIGDAIHRALVVPFLKMHFPGKPVAVKFELGHEEEQSAGDVFDLAAKAKTAGYVVEKGQLEERTGFILEKDAAMGGFGMMNSTGDTREAVANPLQNDFPKQDDKILANSEKTLQSAILGFSQDMKGTAKSLQDLLAADDEEFLAKAKAMAEASPEELGFKADGLAAEIEADIAHEVADTLGEKSVKNSEQEEEWIRTYILTNTDSHTISECRAEDKSKCRYHGNLKRITQDEINKLSAEEKKEFRSDILSGKLKPVNLAIVEFLLETPITITCKSGDIVRFSKERFLSHLKDRNPSDLKRRTDVFLYGINAVKEGDSIEHGGVDKQNNPTTFKYFFKKYNVEGHGEEFVVVKATMEGDVFDAFTVMPKKEQPSRKKAVKKQIQRG